MEAAIHLLLTLLLVAGCRSAAILDVI